MEYALIGKTLKHSFSVEIHPKLFNCNYELKELAENEIEAFMRKKDFKGINVTIPYKTAVIPYIDVLHDTAQDTKIVNTVVNKDGVLHGYNTDYSGLGMLVKSNNVSLKNKFVLIFGNGATSVTAKAFAENSGAKAVVRLARKTADGCDLYENISNYYDKAQVIINTTPCGMFPDICESVAELEPFKCLEAVFDVIYNPIRSKLVCDAQNMGIVSAGGTMMLVFQAIFAARLFSGMDIPDSKGIEIYRDIINSKQNIVLVGMPASGKTTIGNIIAKRLGKKFVDTDCEIEKKYSKSAGEIITESGEEFFRNCETEIIKEVSLLNGCVIATGGGAVLKKVNTDLLKENGKIVFLDRNPKKLIITDSRPLSSTYEKLAKLYEERFPIYKSVADICVDSNVGAEEAANQIIKESDL